MMTKPNRVSAGVPTGGEFARNHQAPADITLDGTADEASATETDETPEQEASQVDPERPFRDWSETKVDTEIVRISSKIHRAQQTISQMQTAIAQANDYRTRNRISDDQLQARLAPLEAELAKAEAKSAVLQQELSPYGAEFQARGGWPRGWYVPGGHIHRGDHCPSLRPTTQIGLVVELSGQSEDEIVEAAGETACTVCYPDAPVDVLKRAPTVALPDRVEADRARKVKDDANTAKAAKAALNTLSWGGRKPVYDSGQPITKVTEARSALQSSIYYGMHQDHFPINIADAGRDVVEASYRMRRSSSGDDPARTEDRIEMNWQHAQKAASLHAALVEKKVELGESEADAVKSLNKSLVTSMKKTYGVTPNVEMLDEQQIADRQEWAARTLTHWRPEQPV